MRLTTVLTAGLVLALLVLVPATASAASAITIAASDDGFGHHATGDSNYGTGNNMYTKFTPGYTDNYKSWAQFDLSSVTQEIATATFQIYNEFESGGAALVDLTSEVFALNDLDEDEGWDEATLTYNNGPANEGFLTVNGFDPARTTDMISTIAYQPRPSVGLFQFSSAKLAAAVNADTNGLLTLCLVQVQPNAGTGDPPEGYTGFSPSWVTREHATLPAATLVLVPVPEPSTFALGIGMAMVLASCRRRRRR